MIYGMEGMLVDDGVPIAYKPQDVVLKRCYLCCIRRRDNWFIKSV